MRLYLAYITMENVFFEYHLMKTYIVTSSQQIIMDTLVHTLSVWLKFSVASLAVASTWLLPRTLLGKMSGHLTPGARPTDDISIEFDQYLQWSGLQ